MDDYYELLGVATDADTDEIRTAYRERKAELEATKDGSKAEVAKLNKAWNVLSDPYQRGRYDAQREQHVDEDDDSDGDDGEANARAATTATARRTNSRDTRTARAPREVGPPTLTPPAGTKWPEPRKRLLAMGIDLFVLFVVVVGMQFAGAAYAGSKHPGVQDRISDLTDRFLDERDEVSDLNKELDDARDNNAPNVAELEARVEEAKAKRDATEDELQDEREKIQPILSVFTLIAFGASLLYLIVPSGITGRTLGKRLMRLKVVREDGTKLRWRDAIGRYGSIVSVAYVGGLVFAPVLGPLFSALVPAGVLFAVLRWNRNNNMQGVHDRFAHTIVVSDAQN